MKLKLKNVFLAYFLVSIAGLLYALVQLGERGRAGVRLADQSRLGDEPPRRHHSCSSALRQPSAAAGCTPLSRMHRGFPPHLG